MTTTTTTTALRAVDEDVEEITKKYGLEAGLFSIFKSKGGQGKAVQAKDLLAKYGSAYLLTSISLSLVSFGLCYALINAGVDVASLLGKVRRRRGRGGGGRTCVRVCVRTLVRPSREAASALRSTHVIVGVENKPIDFPSYQNPPLSPPTQVGITATSQSETAGTVALAYAAHKAASPIRFPPTVALTPFVANAIVRSLFGFVCVEGWGGCVGGRGLCVCLLPSVFSFLAVVSTLDKNEQGKKPVEDEGASE